MGAERSDIVVADHQGELVWCELHACRHDEPYAAGDRDTANLERFVAGVVQLEIVKVRPLAGVVHQLTQDEVALEVLERVRFAGPELDRVGPVTPAVGVVEHPHAGPVPVAHLSHAFGDRDTVGKLADDIRLPHGIDLVPARVERIVRRGVGRGDFGQTPFHPGELPGFVGER